jgi:N-methylhydantoinase A
VTDAHVVLGRIAEDQLVGGAMRIDADRAEVAVSRIGKALGLGTAKAAAGIVRVANASMERAIRAVSIERGRDPRDYALLAFGGCGGLHACDIAESLGIRTVLVPQHAGALSALGMLLADGIRDHSAGVLGSPDVAAEFRRLKRDARAASRVARLEHSADLRYEGQSYEINVPWSNLAGATAAFHDEHDRVYGYCRREAPVEVVTIRVRAVREVAKPKLSAGRVQSASRQFGQRRCFAGGRWCRVPVMVREDVGSRAVTGPALVLDYGSTTVVGAGWTYRRDRVGSLVIERR